MHIEFKIEFQQTPPTREEILKKLREYTGLDIMLDLKKNEFAHPFFEQDGGFFFRYKDNNLSIIRNTQETSYIFGVLLKCMVDMGGTINRPGFTIPEWANKKWEYVKKIFPDDIDYENTMRSVEFHGQAPTLEEILRKYEENTGLTGVRLNKDDNEIIHDMIPEKSIMIYLVDKNPKKSSVVLGIHPDNKLKNWYFVEALIATLFDLGGEAYELSDKAWKKWEEAKELYVNR